jgi:hypothetical protein
MGWLLFTIPLVEGARFISLIMAKLNNSISNRGIKYPEVVDQEERNWHEYEVGIAEQCGFLFLSLLDDELGNL